jgi:hypothetical protein
MKKLLFGLFLFSLLIFGTKIYAAEEGCQAEQNYSSATGQKCGCSHNEVYSSTTGQTCPTNNSSVKVLSPNGGETFKQGQSNRISWSGGKNIVQVGLVNPSYASNVGSAPLGWIELKGNIDSNITWDGKSVKDLMGNYLDRVSPGKYKILTVSENSIGNYCSGPVVSLSFGTTEPCNFDLSDNYFTITNSTIEEGCPAGQNYSSVTGQKCGCSHNEVYSSTTGQKCSVELICPPNMPNPFSLCSDGKIEPATRDANQCVTSWKCVTPKDDDGCSKGEVYSSTTGQACPQKDNPIISGVSGPQSLKVGEHGTWKVTAYDSNGGTLSYSVNWGDEVALLYATSNSTTKVAQQSATFTHVYNQAGIYNPTFVVTSENTIRCFMAPCPSNLGSANTSVSVIVNNSTNVCPSGCVCNKGMTTCPVELIDYGCLAGSKYSITTGQACPSDIAADDGCLPGFNYSSTTGQQCLVIVDNGCNGTRFSTTTGKLCPVTNTSTPIRRTLKRGIKGEDVKRLQLFLNLNADGSFGSQTQAKVMEWQAQNGLTPDGAFGTMSRKKAGLEE